MRVVVTRPLAQAASLAEALERAGHEVVVCPLIDVEPVDDEAIDLAPYDWLIVTSANGARELARRGRGRPRRIAAIGRATAAALGEAGFAVDFVPTISTQEGLVAELPPAEGRVLVAAAEDARRLLVDELGAEFVALYRTRALRPPEPPAGDVVMLASGSAARAFAALGVPLPAVSIGPETTRVAEAAGLTVVAEARTQDVEGLVGAVDRVRA